MIADILKTLSDTELVAISKEVINPAVSNLTIYKQLMGKRNDYDDTIDTSDFSNLPNTVINELTNRLLERDLALYKRACMDTFHLDNEDI